MFLLGPGALRSGMGIRRKHPLASACGYPTGVGASRALPLRFRGKMRHFLQMSVLARDGHDESTLSFELEGANTDFRRRTVETCPV